MSELTAMKKVIERLREQQKVQRTLPSLNEGNIQRAAGFISAMSLAIIIIEEEMSNAHR